MASTAALFDRQQLQSRQDMLMLGQILNDVMQQFIEVRDWMLLNVISHVFVFPTVFERVFTCLVVDLTVCISRRKDLRIHQNLLRRWKHRRYVS